MACPTCDHTMHMVGKMMEPLTAAAVFWCPRCGTLKSNVVVDDQPFDGSPRVPELVGRVIEFGGLLTDEQFAPLIGQGGNRTLIAEFERIGLAESISLER